jgi:hypothetical protein
VTGAIWLYTGIEGVAGDGEHGYRRIERRYVPWQGRRGAIWLYAGTEYVAAGVESAVYRMKGENKGRFFV